MSSAATLMINPVRLETSRACHSTADTPPDAFLARFGPHGIRRVEALILAEAARRQQIEGGEVLELEAEDVDGQA